MGILLSIWAFVKALIIVVMGLWILLCIGAVIVCIKDACKKGNWWQAILTVALIATLILLF